MTFRYMLMMMSSNRHIYCPNGEALDAEIRAELKAGRPIRDFSIELSRAEEPDTVTVDRVLYERLRRERDEMRARLEDLS